MDKIDELKTGIKDKFDAAKAWLKPRYEGLERWAKNHPTEAISIAAGAIGITGSAIKRHDRKTKERLEERRHNREIYDHSVGHYWVCKRDIKPQEFAQIDYRHRTLKEPYYNILSDMGLL